MKRTQPEDKLAPAKRARESEEEIITLSRSPSPMGPRGPSPAFLAFTQARDLEFEQTIQEFALDICSEPLVSDGPAAIAKGRIMNRDPVASFIYHAKHTLKWIDIKADFASLFFLTFYTRQALSPLFSLGGWVNAERSRYARGLYDQYNRMTLHGFVLKMQEFVHTMQERWVEQTQYNIDGFLAVLIIMCVAAQFERGQSGILKGLENEETE